MTQKQPSREYISNLLADCGQQARAAASLPMTHTHKINAQTPGKARASLSESGDNGIYVGMTLIAESVKKRGYPTSTFEHNANAPVLAAGFTMLNNAGRALGVDAAELGESINLVAIFDVLEHSLVYLEAQHKAGLLNDPSGQLALGQTRTQLAKLSKPV